MKRVLMLTMTGSLIVGGSALLTGQAQGAASMAGRWHAAFSIKCVDSAQNAKICGKMLGVLPATGKKGTTVSEVGSVTFAVAANGHYTDRGSAVLTEVAPHAAPPKKCANDVATRLTNGTCTLTETGHGHLAKGPLGLTIFYEDVITITVSKPPVAYTYKGKDANTGAPTPAKAGTYTQAWVAQVFGFKSAAPGFTARLVVTRG
jgi:hypothetical protein